MKGRGWIPLQIAQRAVGFLPTRENTDTFPGCQEVPTKKTQKTSEILEMLCLNLQDLKDGKQNLITEDWLVNIPGEVI